MSTMVHLSKVAFMAVDYSHNSNQTFLLLGVSCQYSKLQ